MSCQISQSLKEFREALNTNVPFSCSKGSWKVQGWFTRAFKAVFYGAGREYCNAADELSRLIGETEKFPVIFCSDGASIKQPVDYQEYIETGLLLVDKLSEIATRECVTSKHRLSHALLAMQYRLEAVNGGLARHPVQKESVNLLKDRVLKWKNAQETIADDAKKLTERDLLQIQTTSQYPEFFQLLLEDEELCEAYMRWTFRDGNQACIMIEYPNLYQKLVESNLSGRIGRISEHDLKIVKRPFTLSEGGGLEKVVTLPFDGIEKSILDPDLVVEFRGDYSLTIAEIFKIFRNKTYAVGNLEYLAHGVTNWNTHYWGYWDAHERDYINIDLNHKHWWEQLPVFEICTIQQLKERYGKVLNGTEWAVAATATRGSRSLDYENTHAFLEVAIPWGDGRYAIYDFGKFAMKFPSSFFEGISIFCHNLHATVAYPDENVFYSHREQIYHAYTITCEQGFELMSQIKEDMLKSQKLNFVYQIESDNCAKWVYHHLEEIFGVGTLPNMFCMHLLDTEPHSPVAIVFNCIKMLPLCMQTRTLMAFHFLLGASKKTWIIENGRWVCKSLTRHIFWQTGEVFLPALLHKKIEEGEFENVAVSKLLKVNGLYVYLKERLKWYGNCWDDFLRYSKRFFGGMAYLTLGALLSEMIHMMQVNTSRNLYMDQQNPANFRLRLKNL